MKNNFILCSLFFCSILTSFGQDINIGKRHIIFSESMNESRQYTVLLPTSYNINPNQKYPVLYVIDGEYNLRYLAGLMEQESAISENIPEMIVVGIAARGTETYRNNCKPKIEGVEDSGTAAKKLSFIKDELIPHIDSNYKASNYKILGGHSAGGLFVTNVMLDHPNLFNNYIAISPSLWWSNYAMSIKASAVISNNPEFKTSAYFTVANEWGMGINYFLGAATSCFLLNTTVISGIGFAILILAIVLFIMLKKRNKSWITFIFSPLFLLVCGVYLCYQLLYNFYPTDSNFKFKKFGNETHNSVGQSSYKWALNSIFESWKIKGETLLSASDLLNHYEITSGQFGIATNTIANTVGYTLRFNDIELEKIGKELEKHYPYQVTTFYNTLSDNLLAEGKVEEAEDALNKAIEANPNSFESFDKLAKIRLAENKLEEADSLSTIAIDLATKLNARQWQINEIAETKKRFY